MVCVAMSSCYPSPPPPTSCPQVSPDCDSFPTLWYNITIRRGDDASNQTQQVEAKDFPPLNDSMVTITVIFERPLPQGMLNAEVLKVNAVPVKELDKTGSPVYTQDFQYWTSSSKATGKCINAHMYCTSSN